MSKNMLQGKVAIITGGAKNLGGLISINFAAQGAKVVIHYHSDSTTSDAQELLDAIKADGGEAVLFQADLTKPDNMAKLFEFAKEQYGHIDIAVNTVGKVLRAPTSELSEADYDSMFDINTKTAFFFIQECAKHLANKGKVINILTSLLAAFTDGYSLYAGSKASVEHFTRAAAKELAGRTISVNTVAPGPMETPFFYDQETPERVEYHKSQAMGNQLTQIEDIAPIVEFLATAGWWITGQTIFANGGYTVR